ncbi:MAG: class I SAM-dependent methyltransferase [Chloroflexi bacterium]|nr:MAG: class I SAM-dependent methyltransferase [Chloroflexota bacterium]TME46379.1 MAG: class I SAM-dependent methyltransferase [Chloroflexota bacterium]
MPDDPVRNPKDIVREGYDRISYSYRDDAGTASDRYEEWLAQLTPLLEDGDPVLDIGCGCGVPATKLLAQRFLVTGVDLSAVQVERARRLVPAARFLCEDITLVGFEEHSFSAIVCLFTLIHIPLDEQPAIIRKLGLWLRPGGYLLATVGTKAWTGIDENWHGAPMYWSHTERQTYLRWLEESGFKVLWDRFIPEGTGGHTLVLARSATESVSI